MKKLFALSATTVAALALTACQPSSSTTATASAPPVKSTTAPATKAPTNAKNSKPSKANPPADSPSTSKNPTGTQTGGTKVSYVWPDSSWNIANESRDICADLDSEASPSPFGVYKDRFTCGAMASNLEVCKKEKAGTVLCINNYAERQAVRFRSDVTGTHQPGNRYASPLHVILSDGVTCDPVSHDQTDHPAGRSSWLWCNDGSALLTKTDNTGGYFNTSNKTWTAERSVGTNAPTVTSVKSVVYAG